MGEREEREAGEEEGLKTEGLNGLFFPSVDARRERGERGERGEREEEEGQG